MIFTSFNNFYTYRCIELVNYEFNIKDKSKFIYYLYLPLYNYKFFFKNIKIYLFIKNLFLLKIFFI